MHEFNLEHTFEQSRLVDRVEFCFDKMLTNFPFIYGYILDHVLYGKSKKSTIYDLVNNIIENGVKKMLRNAAWMDIASYEKSIKKINNLGIFVGYVTLLYYESNLIGLN